MTNPAPIIKLNHKTLYFNLCGINAYNSTVSTVKAEIECPEGKLLCPVSVFPMITKLLLSNTAAGLGTENTSFNEVQIAHETSDADIKLSQILGAYIIKTPRKENKTIESPSWVRLNIVFGN
jgi:hypothetical protein